MEDTKPEIVSGGGVGIPWNPPEAASMTDYLYFDRSDSVPKLHTESSCSDHVVSPEFASEVQSESKWNNEWEKSLELPYSYGGATALNNGCEPQIQSMQSINQVSSLQDIFTYFQKPF